MNNALQDAMKAAERSVTEIAAAPASTEIERLLATGERLLRSQQERLLNEESKYQTMRIEIMDSYRVQLERIRQEAEDRLRVLDSEHNVRMSGIRNLIGKLKAMREA